MANYSVEESRQIERLIRISIEKPMQPETFVPWNIAETAEHVFLPEKLVSLVGLPMYETLSAAQKRELGRREVVQALYAYCWSEGLFCVFMTRYILHRLPDDLERRFLMREIIEECRHQEMFAAAIKKLGGRPVPVTRFQRAVGQFIVQVFPVNVVFLSCIAVEMMADRYGEHLRLEPDVFPVLQKISQLHNIEEARHILFTKALLRQYTQGAGFWRGSWYSLIVLINMRFFQSIYIRSEIYQSIGLENPRRLRRQAFRHYQARFATACLDSVREFMDSFNGYNWLTRPLWRWVMKM
ncbi:MAG: diiron oxygenase [Saprospiraceae bacterium]